MRFDILQLNAITVEWLLRLLGLTFNSKIGTENLMPITPIAPSNEISDWAEMLGM